MIVQKGKECRVLLYRACTGQLWKLSKILKECSNLDD